MKNAPIGTPSVIKPKGTVPEKNSVLATAVAESHNHTNWVPHHISQRMMTFPDHEQRVELVVIEDPV